MNIRSALRAIASLAFVVSFFSPWFGYMKLCMGIRDIGICGKPIAVYPFWSVIEGEEAKYILEFENLAVIAAVVFVLALTVLLNALRNREREKEPFFIFVVAFNGLMWSVLSFAMSYPGFSTSGAFLKAVSSLGVGAFLGFASSLLLLATLVRKNPKKL